MTDHWINSGSQNPQNPHESSDGARPTSGIQLPRTATGAYAPIPINVQPNPETERKAIVRLYLGAHIVPLNVGETTGDFAQSVADKDPIVHRSNWSLYRPQRVDLQKQLRLAGLHELDDYFNVYCDQHLLGLVFTRHVCAMATDLMEAVDRLPNETSASYLLLPEGRNSLDLLIQHFVSPGPHQEISLPEVEAVRRQLLSKSSFRSTSSTRLIGALKPDQLLVIVAKLIQKASNATSKPQRDRALGAAALLELAANRSEPILVLSTMKLMGI